MTIPTLRFRWEGDSFVPLAPKLADQHFVIGQDYSLSERRDRSDKSHSQYFSVVQWAWDNLPEELAEQLPDPEDLRAKALIATGYATPRQFVARSNAQALEIAAFISVYSGYRVISIHENIVTELQAKSQSYKAMGADEFKASKKDVIEYCAALIGVTVESLVKASKADWEVRKQKVVKK
jgi:hypothetical protein